MEKYLKEKNIGPMTKDKDVSDENSWGKFFDTIAKEISPEIINFSIFTDDDPPESYTTNLSMTKCTLGEQVLIATIAKTGNKNLQGIVFCGEKYLYMNEIDVYEGEYKVHVFSMKKAGETTKLRIAVKYFNSGFTGVFTFLNDNSPKALNEVQLYIRNHIETYECE